MLQKKKLRELMNWRKRQKQTGLTEIEAKEQSKLRSEYLATFRSSIGKYINKY